MQVFMWIIFFYLGFLVFLLIFALIKSIKVSDKDVGREVHPTFSILIASRNEEKNVDRLLEMLSKQHLQPEQIVWVDDHSTDRTVEKVQEWQKKIKGLHLVHLPSGITGKRNAWKEGLKYISTSLVLCIDADSVPLTERWTKSMLTLWGAEIKLLSGPVFGLREKGFFSQWVYHEHAVVVLLGHLSGVLSFPVYVSGANILFKKEDFLQYLSSCKSLTSGYGDDTLFMKFIIDNYGRSVVKFAYGKNAVVQTQLPTSLRRWINQRRRWLAKTHMFIFSYIFWLSLLVLMLDLSFFILLFYFPIKGLILLLVKNLLQAVIFYISGKKFFGKKFDFSSLFFVMLVFGLIYLILSISSFFCVKHKL